MDSWASSLAIIEIQNVLVKIVITDSWNNQETLLKIILNDKIQSLDNGDEN